MQLSIENFKKNINLSIKKNDKELGLKEINITQSLINKSDISNDLIVSYLGIIQKFYKHFNFIEEEIDTLLFLADIYSSYGAFQSSYRILSEAEEIANENNNILALAKIYMLMSAISFTENDFDFALKMGKESIKIYKHLKKDIPSHLIINMAIIYMNKGELKKAIKQYKSLLNTKDINLLFAIYLNLTICYRKDKNIKESIKCMKEANKIKYKIDYNPEQSAEFELVSATTYLKDNQFKMTLKSLENAVNHLNTMLLNVNKLHFRRGIREKYIIRIEKLLLSIPNNELNDKILTIISFIRSTLVSDWLYILNWSNYVYENTKISTTEKNKLKDILNKLTNFGAPFLYGLREKYDDHYDEMNPWGSSWKLLNEFIFNITTKYKINNPYFKTDINRISKLFKQRLSENNCIIISFLAFHSKLIILYKEKYLIININKTKIYEFYESISKYRTLELSTSEFATKVSIIENELYNNLINQLDYINEINISSIMYIPDRFDFIPMQSIVLKHNQIKEKMLTSKFTIKTTPILFPTSKITINTKKILGVVDDIENLYLSKLEVDNFSKILNIPIVKYINSKDQNSCSDEMKDTNILHVTTHGFPINNFLDPHYVDLNGHQGDTHCINTNEIQERFYKYNYNLVILNSCHSSSSIVRSHQSNTGDLVNELKTNDIFNFPIILLMNRKSVVISSIWRTFDKFALLFSYNLGKNMKESNNIEQSFSKSISSITELNYNSISHMIKDLDDNSKEFIASNIKNIEQMVKHPYCYGTYQLYTLF